METYNVRPIGFVRGGSDGAASIVLDEQYRTGLAGLGDFSYAMVLWWCHLADGDDLRQMVDAGKPYVRLDHDLGIFATRSPVRPNPIALSAIEVSAVDVEAGIISTPHLDAADGTPVLDIKPYTPSADRVEDPEVPAWCVTWPKSVETSGDFDWAAEFAF